MAGDPGPGRRVKKRPAKIERPALLIVAAVARNGVIGGQNRLLWRLASDLKRFKALTLRKPLVMGRKTFQSIGGPLPGRETIVVTRDPGFHAAGAFVMRDLDVALLLASEWAEGMKADTVVIAGGQRFIARRSTARTASPLPRWTLRPQARRSSPRSVQMIGSRLSARRASGP